VLLQDYDNIDVVFTAQEEIGLIGAEAIHIKKNYNYIIAIDCIAENNVNNDVIQQNGPILVLKDGLVVYNYHILEQFESIAQDKSIPYKILVSDNGGLEASKLFTKNQKVCSLCVPITHSHSYKQTVEIVNIERTINLIKNIISYSV
jgi:putative aminopeptidase FrvX